MNLRTKSVGIVLTLVFATARPGSAGAQDTSSAALLAQRGVLAESILAAKERAMGEPFDASIRAYLKSRMEALSSEQLAGLSQQGADADIPLVLGSVTSDLVYTPVTPCRVFDSRISQGGQGPIPANSQRNFLVSGTVGFPLQGGFPGGCGVPVGATSAIINFVTVSPAGPGDIRAWAVANPQPVAPLAAILNYGTVAGLPAIANGVAVPLCDPAATSCALGDLRLQADTSATNILGDVVGYFGPATGLVTSVNSITGPVTIAAGTNLAVTSSGGTVTIANTAPVNSGTVTSVTAGTGLSGGAITTSGTIGVDFGGTGAAVTAARSDHNHTGTYLPATVSACPAGSSIQTINPDGTVGCQGISERVFRYMTFDTYLEICCWSGDNNASLFGGVPPSTWTDGNGQASDMSSNSDVLRTLFVRKLYPGKNALVNSERWSDKSSTNGKVTAVLMRIRNSTPSAIPWQPFFYFTAYASWGERASVALNGVNVWNSNGDYGSNTTASPTLTLPANQTSTVIFVVPSSPPWNASPYYRMNFFAFYNDSLNLPPGLSYKDDLESVTGNLW